MSFVFLVLLKLLFVKFFKFEKLVTFFSNSFSNKDNEFIFKQMSFPSSSNKILFDSSSNNDIVFMLQSNKVSIIF